MTIPGHHSPAHRTCGSIHTSTMKQPLSIQTSRTGKPKSHPSSNTRCPIPLKAICWIGGVPHGAGFIPAHAVNTHNAARVARLPGDHSQVGWLPPSCAPHHYSEKDSSLLTRGIRDPMPVGHGDRRIIPTHVGNTSPGLRKHHASQADYGSMVERLSLNYSSHRTPTTKEARLESLVRHICERLQARQTSNH